MGNRLEQLRKWGLTAPLLLIADGDLPHPGFEAWCEPLRYDERREVGLSLDRVETRDETGGHASAARRSLWASSTWLMCSGLKRRLAPITNGMANLLRSPCRLPDASAVRLRRTTERRR